VCLIVVGGAVVAADVIEKGVGIRVTAHVGFRGPPCDNPFLWVSAAVGAARHYICPGIFATKV
jgi:hypothetical protein